MLFQAGLRGLESLHEESLYARLVLTFHDKDQPGLGLALRPISQSLQRIELAVYAVAMVLLAAAMLHTHGCTQREDLETLRRENSRHWRRKLLCLVLILAAVGTVYILRTGDGMLSVSVGEQRVRNWLERVLLFRPRTKEFLIAYPAIAAAYCCAAHRSRLTAWLFGVFGAIGFASVANTFCHIRAHFLVSLLRTGIGLVLGLVLGAIVLLILRACWPVPSDATQTKE